MKFRYGGGDRRDTGGNADRDGQHVIDEQRRARGQARAPAQILERNDIGAAAVRIRAYRLPVGCGHNDDEKCYYAGDGKRIVEIVRAGEQQDEQNLLGGVGARRERVRGEDRERLQLRQALVRHLSGRERAAENYSFDRLDEALEAAAGAAADLSRFQVAAPDLGELALSRNDSQVGRPRSRAIADFAQLDIKV